MMLDPDPETVGYGMVSQQDDQDYNLYSLV